MSKFDAQFAGRLDGQTVLVTGANGGIGHETAQGIGNSGATVLVHARGADHARRAVDLLVTNGNGNGHYLAVGGDLGSLAGVRELVDAVHRAAPKGLNGLVNNAGAAFSSKALSPDGYERTIAINHVALAALTDGLLDLLRKGADDLAAPSRVVNMTALDRIEEASRSPTGATRVSTSRSRPTARCQTAGPDVHLRSSSPSRGRRPDVQRSQPGCSQNYARQQGRRPFQNHPGGDQPVHTASGEGITRLCATDGRPGARKRNRGLLQLRDVEEVLEAVP